MIFFFKDVQCKKEFFFYEVFILRSQRLNNLNCVLFLTVVIKALGICLVLNYALKFCETMQ